MTPQRRPPHRQQGLGLLQVLVGLSMLATGLTGLHAHHKSLAAANESASQRARVSLALHSHLETLRSCLATADPAALDRRDACESLPLPSLEGVRFSHTLSPGPLATLWAVSAQARWTDAREKAQVIAIEALIDEGGAGPGR